MKIAYILLHYPVFSETFVSNEILNFQQNNIESEIWYEKTGDTTQIHPNVKKITAKKHKITPKILSPKSIFALTKDHIFWLLLHPVKYIRSLAILFQMPNFHHLRIFIKSFSVAKEIASSRCNIIYVHEVDSPCLIGLISSCLLNIPCVIIFHTQYLFAQNNFLKTKIKYADLVIFQSKYSKNIAQKKIKTNIYSEKIKVIYSPGVDVNFFKPKPIVPHPHSIICIGRLCQAKGYIFLLKAIKRLIPIFPNIKCTIVGEGSDRLIIEKYIYEHRLQNNVDLCGAIGHNQKLLNLLHSHELFVLASIIDNQNVRDVHPNVVKEAMSTALLTATSNLGGIDEIIINTKNGFTFKSANVNSLINCIKKAFLLSENRKNQIRQFARNTIVQYHNSSTITHDLIKTFHLTLKNHK